MNKQSSLFKQSKLKSEVAIQTDQKSPLKLESHNSQSLLKTLMFEQEVESIKNVPDDFKKDWKDSVIFKNAMKKEAIKRDMPYEKYKKYELKSDEEEMSTI